MKVINKTTYRTDDLKAFFSAGLAKMGAQPETVVRVEYGKRFKDDYKHGFGGTHAAYHRPFVRMVVPRDLSAHLPLAARIFEHEVLHNFNLKHPDMDERGTAEWIWFSGIVPEWSVGLTIREKERAPAPTLDGRIAARRAKAEAMVVRWERKLAIAKKMELLSEIESHRAALETRPPEVVLKAPKKIKAFEMVLGKHYRIKGDGEMVFSRRAGDVAEGYVMHPPGEPDMQSSVVIFGHEEVEPVEVYATDHPATVTASNSTAVLAAEIARLRAFLRRIEELERAKGPSAVLIVQACVIAREALE